jgi:DNA-binding NtrC family response regulator
MKKTQSSTLAQPGQSPEIQDSFELIKQPAEAPDPTIHQIHLIDHDSGTLLYLYDYLSNAALRVSASSNALDAIDFISRSHPEIVVAELDMPEMNGLELLDRMRDLSPRTRIILMSACADWPLYEEVLRHHGVDLIPKPVNARVLLRAVEKHLLEEPDSGRPGEKDRRHPPAGEMGSPRNGSLRR